MREWFRVEAAAAGQGGGEILIFGRIGTSWWAAEAVGAKAFVEELDALIAAGPGDVHIRINSPGGDVWDGTAIYNGIRRHKDRVYTTIEGVAFSMASVIALAGREVRMWDTAQFMVHRPQTIAMGEEKDLEQAIQALKTARKTLVTAYRAKTALSVQEVEDLMSATTFMTAEEAQTYGFVDTVLGAEEEPEAHAARLAACFDVGAWERFYRGAGPLPGPSSLRFAGASQGENSSDATRNVGDGTGKPLRGLPVAPEGNEGKTGAGAPEKEDAMSKLTAKEIREACPGASAEFVLEQVEACDGDEKRGLVDVLKAHGQAQAKALETARAEAKDAKEAAEAKAKADAEAKAQASASTASAGQGGAKPAGKALGVSALDGGEDGGDEDGGGDPVSAWHDLVASFEKRGMDKQAATVAAVKKDGDLHKRFVQAYNAERGRRAAAI